MHMATSNPSSTGPHQDAPFARRRRRTIMACLTCRQRKIRVCLRLQYISDVFDNRRSHFPWQCVTSESESPPKNPCRRCARKNLPCEYVPTDKDEYSSSPQSPEFPEFPSSPIPPPPASPMPPSWNPPAPFPDFSTSSTIPRGGPSSLPYTGPPPLNRLPRYAGRPLPDLSLSSQSTPMPTYIQPSPDYPLYNAPAAAAFHTYGHTNVPPFVRPAYGVPPAPQTVPHLNSRSYTPLPMPFFADTSMPTFEGASPFDWSEEDDPAAECVMLILICCFTY